VAAIELLARTEGILLDPVYSGKAFAGLVARVREGAFRDGQNIVFWHTGGSAALCAYRRDFAPPPPLSAGVKQGAAI
jgi:1-aminocyclopropane-1-carboxylate deaminase/D-cysteine desulfhydrase-like pyridoxal-dependent ACC family enzyme